MSPEFWSENTPWLDGIMQKGRQNLLMLQMAMYRILGHVVEALTYSSPQKWPWLCKRRIQMQYKI